MLPETCLLRPCKYLNNVIEQDHRFMKRHVNLGLGFGAFATAQRTIQGYEAMHMLRKGQIEGLAKRMSSPRTMPSTSYSGWPDSESSPASPHPPTSLCNTPPILPHVFLPNIYSLHPFSRATSKMSENCHRDVFQAEPSGIHLLEHPFIHAVTGTRRCDIPQTGEVFDEHRRTKADSHSGGGFGSWYWCIRDRRSRWNREKNSAPMPKKVSRTPPRNPRLHRGRLRLHIGGAHSSEGLVMGCVRWPERSGRERNTCVVAIIDKKPLYRTHVQEVSYESVR